MIGRDLTFYFLCTAFRLLRAPSMWVLVTWLFRRKYITLKSPFFFTGYNLTPYSDVLVMTISLNDLIFDKIGGGDMHGQSFEGHLRACLKMQFPAIRHWFFNRSVGNLAEFLTCFNLTLQILLKTLKIPK